MMVNGKMDRRADMEPNLTSLMEVNMKENIIMIDRKELGPLYGVIKKSILVNGDMVYFMEKVPRQVQMAQCILENGEMDFLMVRVNANMKIEADTMDSGEMGNLMEKELNSIWMEASTPENG